MTTKLTQMTDQDVFKAPVTLTYSHQSPDKRLVTPLTVKRVGTLEYSDKHSLHCVISGVDLINWKKIRRILIFEKKYNVQLGTYCGWLNSPHSVLLSDQISIYHLVSIRETSQSTFDDRTNTLYHQGRTIYYHSHFSLLLSTLTTGNLASPESLTYSHRTFEISIDSDELLHPPAKMRAPWTR